MNGERFVAARVEGEQSLMRLMHGLQEAGIPRRNIEVLSEIPLPESVTHGPMRATRLLWFTLAGLASGLAAGIFLAVIAPLLYPLIVGGQRPVTVPSLVILYELSMFGTVVATVIGFVLEMRPWRTAKRPYWPGVAEGETYVVIEPPPDFVPARVAHVLEANGGELVEIEEAAG